MKARSGSYDNDPWGSARNSRSGSKETLNTTGYGTTAYNNTVNGCKDPPCPPKQLPLCLSFFSASSQMPLTVFPRVFVPPSVIIYVATRAFYEPQYLPLLVEGGEVEDAGQRGSWLLQGGRFIEMERCR